MSEVQVLPDAVALVAVRDALARMPAARDDAERVDRIRALEELRSAVAAAQASETAAFAASQRAGQVARGVPAARAGSGIAAQVALAARISHHRAQRFTGWATIATTELPATFTALREGRVSEWRAMIVARETGWLSREHRGAVDAAVAPDLHRLSDRQVERETKTRAYRLDPTGYVTHLANAENDRRVGLRPAPDVMARLTALLPMTQGVAAYAALRRQADTMIAAGDPRGRGQIMADTLVTRITGQACADAVPVEIGLIMTDAALLGSRFAEPDAGDADESEDGNEPALLVGCGPVPAAWARRLIHDAATDTPVWIRRLYRRPTTGQLVAMESRRRLFTAAQRQFVRIRDQDTCRTPWCDAPIRHTDHVRPHADGGPTTISNSQGLCAACNHAKQAPGWTTRVDAAADAVTITTPTGHTYRHRAPDLPGTTGEQAETAASEVTADAARLVHAGRLHAA